MSQLPADIGESDKAQTHAAATGKTGMELQPRALHWVWPNGFDKQKVGGQPGPEDAGLSILVGALRAPVDPNEEAEVTYPDGGIRAWIVLAGSTGIMVPTYGLMTAGGLFQSYWKDNQLASYREIEISWILSVFGFLAIFLAGPAGLLFDRFGARRLLWPSGLVYSISFLGLSFSFNYGHFMGCFVAAGVSGAVLTTVGIAVLNHWFEKRKGLAIAIATTGCGIGGIIFSVVLRYLLLIGWEPAMWILISIILGLVSIGSLCIESRVPPRTDKFFDFSCFTSLRFLLTTLMVMGFELVLYAGWGCIPRYAKDAQLGDQFYLMIAFNLGSTFGRLLPGYATDKIGPFNVAIIMATFTLLTMAGVWLPLGNRSEAALYMVAVLFVFGTGSFVATAATCLGHLSDVQDAGKYLGSCYTVVSFATLASNPASHAMLDKGAQDFVVLLVGVLLTSLVSGLFVRRACLGYKWAWLAKV